MAPRPPRWHLTQEPASPSSLAQLGEQALIARIRARAGAPPAWVTVGIGDDAAVLERERNELEVVTTDSLLEDVHFEQALSSPADVGHKALAVNLSDLAAMGARPRWALLSVSVPVDLRTADIDGLVDGFLRLAASHKVALIGGNVSGSPGPVVIGVTAGGGVHPRSVLRRGTGRPGDWLYVTGTVGAAAAGLGWLRSREPDEPCPPDDDPMLACADAHRRPEPRVRVGMLLGRNRAASACIDLSDGLADAVRQIAGASGLGARIDADKIPISDAARGWFEQTGQDPVTAALTGGEDYELLLAVPKKLAGRLRGVARLAGDLPITHIGTLTPEPDLVLRHQGREEAWPQGFRHF